MLQPDQRRAFRDQFRAARAAALRDAEGFSEIFHCLERLGLLLSGPAYGLRGHEATLAEVAQDSCLASDIPGELSSFHIPFPPLFRRVVAGRNDAAHEGAYARTLARHAVELCLIMEDALQRDFMTVDQFMVRGPTCAELWEPISFIRQKMLLDSFSFLPVRTDGETTPWQLVSDRTIARFLRAGAADAARARRERLAMALEDAVATNGFKLEPAIVVPPDTPVDDVARKIAEHPVLVASPDRPGTLLGIVTAFDLL